MAQLKMYWNTVPSAWPQCPPGVSYRTMREDDEADALAWVALCKNGLLGDDDGIESFAGRMFGQEGFTFDSVYFIEENGVPVATTTAIVRPGGALGYVHMVSVGSESRGKGYGTLLNEIVKARFADAGVRGAYLTTDEWRVAAVRSYLRAEFWPVQYDEGMEARWERWLADNGYRDIPLVDEQGATLQTLALKLRLGIFGARRGGSYAKAALLSGMAEIAAVCDLNESSHANVLQHCENEPLCFTDFEEFIHSGLDAVVLTNYFHKHAEFAIRAMRAGVNVFSETTAAVTLQECVKLCRTAEETGCCYMLAENYPYFRAVREMKALVEGGTMGKVLYGEGEYVHPMTEQEYRNYTPSATHWRAQMPSVYYLTHSLAPLMYMTGATPKAVNGKCVYAEKPLRVYEDEPVKDTAAVLLCEMDSGALFRVTGWAKFAPHGTYYRLCCEDGGAEMPRGEEDSVHLTYNSWRVPAGEKQESRYRADMGADYEKAKQCGHNGGDFWVTQEFLRCLKEKRTPFFDVYCACTMAAVGILGWRSCLNGGAEYKIPDFRDEAQRRAVEDDDFSPFSD